ncbi:MAG: Hsp20/alpha crystallin family protein [bacterium]
MVSFIEKLKKGMGVEESEEETETPELVIKTEPKKAKRGRKKVNKLEMRTTPIEEPEEESKEEEIEEESKEEKIPIIEEDKTKEKKEATPTPEEEQWFEAEGQLAIDIYQTENELVIQSAIAGVNAQSVDICLEKDVLVIKGCRRKPLEEKGDYFSQECFWGPFSREIILPAEVDPDKVLARMKDGILTIRIPKILREKRRKITVSA